MSASTSVPVEPSGRGSGPARSAVRRRSAPADDPLAPERTRWLADALGGSGRLAELLGVSASQTSRWASGAERPGVDTAPLLIDLEHVLARVRLVWAGAAGQAWMVGSDAHLGGARPLDVLNASAWGGAA